MDARAGLIKSKPRNSIDNTITLTQQLFIDDVSHQSKEECPNGNNTKHDLITQESNCIGKNITTRAQLGENARELHDKVAGGEYRISKPQHKLGGYNNLGISAALRN